MSNLPTRRRRMMGFNTVNGKHCCNDAYEENGELQVNLFQYRER